MTSYTLRNYSSLDSPRVVDMLNANRITPRAVVDGAGNIRLIRYVPFSSSKVVIEDEQKNIVGYAYVADKENNFVLETGGGVHPDHWNDGVGSMLIQWAQEETLKLSANAPKGVRCVLQVNIFEADDETIRLFEDAGFSKVHEWAHYDIQLEREYPTSKEVNIRAFDLDKDDDWDLVGPVQDAAFMDHWGAYSLPPVESPEPEQASDDNNEDEPVIDSSYSNAQGYCFLAFIDDEVAGGILCNAKLVEFPNTGRVGSVFTNSKFRRKGVGKNLMLSAFNAFYQNGMQRVILDTDSQSFTDSSKFYTSLGMQIYRREFLYEKEIRAGEEIRRLSK
ncbi:MAG TPA: GNAT family N-acetyltransferase [Anaerolineales bacterium]|nr:GNAT family N-acetyltransferase [Anaerolineales bacterium]